MPEASTFSSHEYFFSSCDIRHPYVLQKHYRLATVEWSVVTERDIDGVVYWGETTLITWDMLSARDFVTEFNCVKD